MKPTDVLTVVDAYVQAVQACGDTQRVLDTLANQPGVIGGELVDASYNVLSGPVLDATIRDRVNVLTSPTVLTMVSWRLGGPQRDEQPSCDRHGRAILTVEQLVLMLLDLPGDTHVVIGCNTEHDTEGVEYRNINAVGLPVFLFGGWGGGDYQCVTLQSGSPFDPRQF